MAVVCVWLTEIAGGQLVVSDGGPKGGLRELPARAVAHLVDLEGDVRGQRGEVMKGE